MWGECSSKCMESVYGSNSSRMCTNKNVESSLLIWVDSSFPTTRPQYESDAYHIVGICRLGELLLHGFSLYVDFSYIEASTWWGAASNPTLDLQMLLSELAMIWMWSCVQSISFFELIGKMKHLFCYILVKSWFSILVILLAVRFSLHWLNLVLKPPKIVFECNLR